MTPEQFCYWLQGYYELTNDTDRLSQREHIIRNHLNEVFDKRKLAFNRKDLETHPWDNPRTTNCKGIGI